jgi:drug/metabolite transporter superfamily protein YnfA
VQAYTLKVFFEYNKILLFFEVKPKVVRRQKLNGFGEMLATMGGVLILMGAFDLYFSDGANCKRELKKMVGYAIVCVVGLILKYFGI